MSEEANDPRFKFVRARICASFGKVDDAKFAKVRLQRKWSLLRSPRRSAADEP